PHPDLHSFPTRRSSDLANSQAGFIKARRRIQPCHSRISRYNKTDAERHTFTRTGLERQRIFTLENPRRQCRNRRRSENSSRAHTDRKSTRLNSSHVKIS